MGKLFNMDSPLFIFLGKLADLVYLNILTLICCIPVFTAGAALTALNYVILKMVRNEEGYLTRAFFKSFKQNFKQATVIWLLFIFMAGIFAGDFFIFRYSAHTLPAWFQTALAAVAFVVVFANMHVFPVLAKFENTIKQTFKNSFFMGILSLPKTIAMMVLWVAPTIILIFFVQALPIVFALGISGPAYLCALLYDKTFRRFEPEKSTGVDEGTVMSDLSEAEMKQTDEVSIR